MALIKNNTKPWYRNKAGTAYVRDAMPVVEAPAPVAPASTHLLPLLTGEAQGDFTLAVVMAVRNMLRTEALYCRTARALNSQGLSTEPTSKSAQQWNIFGAIELVTDGVGITADQRRLVLDVIKRGLPASDKGSLDKWACYSTTKHTHVMRLLNFAIGSRKAELGLLRRSTGAQVEPDRLLAHSVQ